ncbi:MAG: hypothetical protein CMM60_04350 [Rhodospirillaceae bacterium]|jgi:hypothetical protein|nr:hypothetical protein [Rhodospirillaceae bacterium]|tara:strand:- start:1262 stop:1573 length:312 start_codon:yes stop_codon:yes gene_type:complete
MPSDLPGDHRDDTLSVRIANQIIDVANARLQDGAHPEEVVQGLRHAAANFSAFVESHRQGKDADPGQVIEEFARLLEYYLGRHNPDAPAEGLEKLIEQAKSEL